ncbi:MAG: hypothetical protein MUC65_01710 [Pontiellaceae bacterium]|nr:hypothetical protein [Pontiellaceae bacterium]
MNTPGKITLLFNVDATGRVVLDAATLSTEQTVQDIVNAWDGPVGTISYIGAFSTAFSLDITSMGGSSLKLTNVDGGGLGVSGQDPWRIDRPEIEFVAATASIKAGSLDFRSVSWNNRTRLETCLTLTSPYVFLTNSFIQAAGSWDVSGQGLLIGDNQVLKFGSIKQGNQYGGYSLAGFTFDLVDGQFPPSFTIGFIRKPGDFKKDCAVAQNALW